MMFDNYEKYLDINQVKWIHQNKFPLNDKGFTQFHHFFFHLLFVFLGTIQS